MIKHHPSDETLFRYAAGTLEPGPRIVVAVHVGGCAICADRIGEFEAVGGTLLEEIEPAEMEADALDRVMALVDAGGSGPPKPAAAPGRPHGVGSGPGYAGVALRCRAMSTPMSCS